MKFDPIEMLSWPAALGKPNEDAFAHADRLVAVFDGATMVADPVLHADSDAAWIARKGAEEAIRNDVESFSAMDILKRAAQAAERDYLAQRFREPISNYENPFASMMLLRLMEGAMDALWFGDCAALVKPPSGEAFLVGETLDLRAGEAALAKSLFADGNIRSPEIVAGLRAGRDRYNNGGKWLFAAQACCAEHAENRRVAVTKGAEILVASDGFFALVSDYERYTPETLLAAIASKGLKALFAELRAIENEDAQCRKYPRFKQSDDATAIFLRVK